MTHESWGDVEATKMVKTKVSPENIWPAWSLRNWVGQNANIQENYETKYEKYRISIYFPSPKDTVSIYFQMCIASIATVSWSLGEILGTFQGLPATGILLPTYAHNVGGGPLLQVVYK